MKKRTIKIIIFSYLSLLFMVFYISAGYSMYISKKMPKKSGHMIIEDIKITNNVLYVIGEIDGKRKFITLSDNFNVDYPDNTDIKTDLKGKTLLIRNEENQLKLIIR